MKHFLLCGVAIVCTTGCGYSAADTMGAPAEPEIPSAPTEPPPTGSRWTSTVVEGSCGRKTIEYALVDEVCGETSSPNYLDAFRTPMFRDGARIGDALFAVDGSHLWTIDVGVPAEAARIGVASGYGMPLWTGVHGTDVVLASGDEGLVLVDATDASRLTRRADVPLSGPALSAYIDGDRALVAAGSAGVAVVDLSSSEPRLDRMIYIPGFAASVAVKDQIAVVAACDQALVVDLTTDQVLSSVWVSETQQSDFAAPAKGVAIVGDVAFVAAGRWGAVAIDIADPTAARVIGNCTVDDPTFYASGVRASGNLLFVAGGEWGVLTADVTVPSAACSALAAPKAAAPAQTTDDACSVEPPWEVVDWQTRWAPPPPPPPDPPPPPPRGRDPVQVLPFGSDLYAFGDARRVGVRAIDIRTADADLVRQGRYEEPGVVQAIAARDGRLLVAGPAGGLYDRDEAQLLVPEVTTVTGIDQAVAAGLLEDGRWVLGFPSGTVRVEGAAEDIVVADRLWPGTLATRSATLFIGASAGIRSVDIDAHTDTLLSYGRTAELPAAVAVGGDRIVAAAPEWTRAVAVSIAGTEDLAPQDVFDESEIMDTTLWRAGLPRRLLAATPVGDVELASLAGEAGLVLHGDITHTTSLPPGDYVGMAAAPGRVHLISADHDQYTSQLVTVALDASGPIVVEIQSFTGMAAAIAVDGDRLYVADADRGIRVYGTPEAIPSPLGVVDLRAAP